MLFNVDSLLPVYNWRSVVDRFMANDSPYAPRQELGLPPLERRPLEEKREPSMDLKNGRCGNPVCPMCYPERYSNPMADTYFTIDVSDMMRSMWGVAPATPAAPLTEEQKAEQLRKNIEGLVKQGYSRDDIKDTAKQVEQDYEEIEEKLDGAASLSAKRDGLTRLSIAYRTINDGNGIVFAESVEFPDGSVVVKENAEGNNALRGTHKDIDALYEKALSLGYIVGHHETEYAAKQA